MGLHLFKGLLLLIDVLLQLFDLAHEEHQSLVQWSFKILIVDEVVIWRRHDILHFEVLVVHLNRSLVRYRVLLASHVTLLPRYLGLDALL